MFSVISYNQHSIVKFLRSINGQIKIYFSLAARATRVFPEEAEKVTSVQKLFF